MGGVVAGGVIGWPAFEQSHITNAWVIGSQTFVPAPAGRHMQFVPGSHSSSSAASLIFLSPSQAGAIAVNRSRVRRETVVVGFRIIDPRCD
jgi:hypothetical protein